jgi:hypothetical protein
MSAAVDTATVDVIYAEAKAKQQQLEQRLREADTKSFALLAAASIVTAAPSLRLLGRALPWYAYALLGVAALCYLGLIWYLRESIRFRDMDFPPRLNALYPAYLEDSAREVKLDIVKAIAANYELNQTEIHKKADAVGKALVILLVESGCLTLALALSS